MYYSYYSYHEPHDTMMLLLPAAAAATALAAAAAAAAALQLLLRRRVNSNFHDKRKTRNGAKHECWGVDHRRPADRRPLALARPLLAAAEN